MGENPKTQAWGVIAAKLTPSPRVARAAKPAEEQSATYDLTLRQCITQRCFQRSADSHQDPMTKPTKRSVTGSDITRRKKTQLWGNNETDQENPSIKTQPEAHFSPKPHVKPHFCGYVQVWVFSSRTRLWVCRSRLKHGG